MLNRVYRLVEPRTIEPVELLVPVGANDVVVRPTHLSICNADQRYYQGRRSARAMAEKLPMALIHEGIGRVVSCGTALRSAGDAAGVPLAAGLASHVGERPGGKASDNAVDAGVIAPGQMVVMLPNAPAQTDSVIAENYLRSSRFCGSGYDGFMQELCVLQETRVLPLPAGIDDEVAAFTELVSVAVHAVTRFQGIAHERRDTVGVWGDGNLGFIVSLVLRALYPGMCLYVFGRNAYKLADFTFVDETFLTSAVPAGISVDHAFECCGGEGSASAIGQIIELIRPEGALSLLGVSENPVPIFTRMVLEKGLRLFGSSRSGRADFERTLSLYRANPWMLDYLRALVGAVVPTAGVRDIAAAFDADLRKQMGKTILEWNV